MKITRLSHAYDFPGFKALNTVRQEPDVPDAVFITLKRQYEKKDQNARNAAPVTLPGTTAGSSGFGISTADIYGYIWNLKSGVSNAGSAVS